MRIFLLLFLQLSYATIIHVPDDYDTIQEGIAAAVESDTVLVDQGTYNETLIIE